MHTYAHKRTCTHACITHKHKHMQPHMQQPTHCTHICILEWTCASHTITAMNALHILHTYVHACTHQCITYVHAIHLEWLLDNHRCHSTTSQINTATAFAPPRAWQPCIRICADPNPLATTNTHSNTNTFPFSTLGLQHLPHQWATAQPHACFNICKQHVHLPHQNVAAQPRWHVIWGQTLWEMRVVGTCKSGFKSKLGFINSCDALGKNVTATNEPNNIATLSRNRNTMTNTVWHLITHLQLQNQCHVEPVRN